MMHAHLPRRVAQPSYEYNDLVPEIHYAFAEQRTTNHHEVPTCTSIGRCMPNTYTNKRTKLGKVSKSEMPNLQRFSLASGTRHSSCNGYSN